MKNTLINAAIDVKTAIFVHLPLSHTLRFFTGCEVDLFVDRGIAIADFHVFFELRFWMWLK